ncbi:DUF4278 domain-containing protein [Oculatella sp. LEGE 06141]|nr:DUF4278 domain-containing protein [Oculatella sp. LEGE 06141]MBE9180366.1 DUF4278 domain-containing protein [Oculatella sp. LEGE 06141]
MKLVYRGVQYDAKPSAIATIPGKVIGHYRGVELHEQIIKTN